MANPSILGAYKVVSDDGDSLVVIGATTPAEFRAAVVAAGLVRMHGHEEGTEHDQPLQALAAMRLPEEGGHVWDLDVDENTPGVRPAMVANAYWAQADSFDAPEQPQSPQTLHAHLLHMLGAKDHADAGRIIAQHHVREMKAVQRGLNEKDAARYQWLREQHNKGDDSVTVFIGDEQHGPGHLDAQIDAAIAAQPKTDEAQEMARNGGCGCCANACADRADGCRFVHEAPSAADMGTAQAKQGDSA